MKTKNCLYTLLLACVVTGTAAAAIPPGTAVRVRMGQTITSDKARSGDTWSGTLANDVVVHGQRVARRGDPVQGRVAEAAASGRLEHPGVLKLQLTSVNGERLSSGIVYRKGQSHKGRDVKAVGGTAALGAVIGAIAGGGRGAAIGAGAGAAAGTAGAVATGKKNVRIPVESVVTFTTR